LGAFVHGQREFFDFFGILSLAVSSEILFVRTAGAERVTWRDCPGGSSRDASGAQSTQGDGIGS
jgi:hypothetical protein